MRGVIAIAGGGEDGAPGLVRLLNAALESVIDVWMFLLRSVASYCVTFVRCFSLLHLWLLYSRCCR